VTCQPHAKGHWRFVATEEYADTHRPKAPISDARFGREKLIGSVFYHDNLKRAIEADGLKPPKHGKMKSG
jgi:hypothetical protein